MKYSVATIVSVLLGVLLIGAGYGETWRVERLHANLAALGIHELAHRYWACQPQKPGESYKRAAVYCAEVNRAMEARANEMPALQVVDVSRPNMMLPTPSDLIPIAREPTPPAGSI
jgi:hypothetical protein